MPDIVISDASCATCGRRLTYLIGPRLVCDNPKCPANGQQFHAPRVAVLSVVDRPNDITHAEPPPIQTRGRKRK